MSRTGHGEKRYPSRSPTPLNRHKIDGNDLGPILRPQDAYIWMRHIMEIEIEDVPEIMMAAASALADDPSIFAELSDNDIATAIEQASAVSKSRAVAWKKRAREMTWLELRMFFLGLKLTR